MKGRFPLTLLLAVGTDANGHNIILAWAVVESENENSWRYFLKLLKEAIPEVAQGVFISDRDKGLLVADAELGLEVFRAYCCKHLDANFREVGGAALSPLFWKAAHAVRPAQFEGALNEIREKKPAEQYLRGIAPAFWAKAYFPRSRYGHDTSNIAESSNSTLDKARELPITRMLDAIWSRVMGARAEHRKSALEGLEKGVFYTQYCTAIVNESRKWYGGNTVSYFYSSTSITNFST
jgi:MULE transposase domain